MPSLLGLGQALYEGHIEGLARCRKDNSMGMIIVPLDGSDIGVRAVQLAASLAEPFDAAVTFVHVSGEDEPRISARATERQPDFARFLTIAEALVGHQMAISTLYLQGDPAEQLLALAEDHPDSMFVIGTRARSGLSRAMFGSVADQILRNAQVPVVVTRDSMAIPRGSIATLLVPLDGSELAEAAIPVALDLARRTDATLVLVRVAELSQPITYTGLNGEADLVEDLALEAQDAARMYLDAMVRSLRPQGIRATWEVRVGRPAFEIMRVAETTAADLIVMSTHGRGGIRRWAFGSVTDDVLHHGSTPMLVVPPRMPVARGVTAVASRGAPLGVGDEPSRD